MEYSQNRIDELIKPFVAHAKRFGIDGVMETARDEYVPFEALVELQTKVDGIEDEQAKAGRRFVTKKTRRISAEDRVKRLCGITDEEA